MKSGVGEEHRVSLNYSESDYGCNLPRSMHCFKKLKAKPTLRRCSQIRSPMIATAATPINRRTSHDSQPKFLTDRAAHDS